MTRLPVLRTERLELRFADPSEAPAVVRYYANNRDFLAPFQFCYAVDFFTDKFWEGQLRKNIEAFEEDRGVHFFVFNPQQTDSPERGIIGSVNFTGFLRRASQFCYLGYGLSEGNEGRGYMTEAVRSAIDYVFQEKNMHRIMANYMPGNIKSARVLRKLGFRIEGFARDYLLLNGKWEDHVMTALVNPNWKPDVA
ncbi:MAG TPA: GNAT family N-acetyltransferase [Candidatus Obscuribacterales bacterium]